MPNIAKLCIAMVNGCVNNEAMDPEARFFLARRVGFETWIVAYATSCHNASIWTATNLYANAWNDNLYHGGVE